MPLVRATSSGDATRLLVLPTLHTSGDQVRIDALNATIIALKDPNIAATVHFYGYWPFSTNIAGGTSYDSNVEADLLGTFERVADPAGRYEKLRHERHHRSPLLGQRPLADPRRLVRPADRGGFMATDTPLPASRAALLRRSTGTVPPSPTVELSDSIASDSIYGDGIYGDTMTESYSGDLVVAFVGKK